MERHARPHLLESVLKHIGMEGHFDLPRECSGLASLVMMEMASNHFHALRLCEVGDLDMC